MDQDFLHIPEAQCKKEAQSHNMVNISDQITVIGVGIHLLAHRKI